MVRVETSDKKKCLYLSKFHVPPSAHITCGYGTRNGTSCGMHSRRTRDHFIENEHIWPSRRSAWGEGWHDGIFEAQVTCEAPGLVPRRQWRTRMRSLHVDVAENIWPN